MRGLCLFSQRRKRTHVVGVGAGCLLGGNAIKLSFQGPRDEGSGQNGFVEAGAPLGLRVGRIMLTLHHCFEHKFQEVGSSWEKVFCVCFGVG